MKLYQSHSISPTFNLAAEEYLFLERSEDVVFLYVNAPSVVIGSNQAIRNEVNLEFCAENNIQIVRRMSGGGAVYHDLENLNYCFISNRQADKPVLSATFLMPVVEALKALNIPVEIGPRKDLWLPGGFKISGTASHVAKNRELHHGTLLYDTDVEKLQKSLFVINKELAVKGVPSIPSTVKNIRTFLVENDKAAFSTVDFTRLFEWNLCSNLNIDNTTSFSKEEIIKIETLESKYKLDSWTFKK
jgi:lipoate-protein ligase A